VRHGEGGVAAEGAHQHSAHVPLTTLLALEQTIRDRRADMEAGSGARAWRPAARGSCHAGAADLPLLTRCRCGCPALLLPSAAGPLPGSLP
jgi:hypothetical protein